MTTQARTKKGNLRLVPRERSPEELLDIEFAEAFAKLCNATDKVPSKAWYKIAEGEQYPGRIIARRIREAKGARLTREEIARAVLAPLRRYIERQYRTLTPSGDFDRVA